MSLSSALSVALSGLQVSTTQLQLAASNIASAQQTGYTEKSLTINSDATGGATIASYSRSTNSALTTSLVNATSSASYFSTQNNYMTQVQSLLDSTDNNPALSSAVSQFQSAWTQFSTAPEDSAQQAQVIQSGANLAQQIRQISASVLTLQTQVQNDTATTVQSLNTDISNVATINGQIAQAIGLGQPTGDLEDERDQAINAIAAITSVNVVPRNNGQVALYTPGGTLLLDGQNPQSFSYSANTTGAIITSSTGQDVTNALTGGSLQAEVQFAYNGSPAAASAAPGSEVIRKLNSQLTTLATALTNSASGTPQSFANAYNSATTASGEQASDFFTVSMSNGAVDPSSLQVNANILNGTATVKQASGATVVTALTAARNFSADGLTANGVTYSGLSTAILSNFQQAANSINSQNTSASQQQTYYSQALSSATGVNVDNELVQLTTLQNSYAASAHVVSTINQMLDTLESVTTT